ncbi:MAG TPA: tRNA (adenosine(37)-N6)-threonylcarbamoyltransferase complex transferase subunit TsaD [Lentisphaeria bacterium]|nr:MAG: tRNA (adenosine(37)-N6)-threonylcarbamoyltransferase complex transferase subunit TsaD [Lentisphaerae bacterium GWF2_49_21]HBC88638.1 tRNA (adenosine(37)-N6)-threonylcarbamoyltransferase complex transferase subunit TsaD [Lentisphaeria bacterium]
MDLILGIETSCDETAASVVADGCEVRSNVVSSQIAKHSLYGGVVPEIAAREHLNAIELVVDTALKNANCAINDISAVAVTNGPGLIPALLVGVNFAKGISAGHKIPLIGINHFIAHIYGSFLENGMERLKQPETYPILSLVVSGGHTALVLITADGTAKIVGTTLDDAAGEAFDKAAKLLNLGYPGGPVIEKTAKKGNPAKFAFPRSLTGTSGRALEKKDRFNFSFSGVKTSLYYHCKNAGGNENIKGELLYDTVASYQEAIVDVLTRKTAEAAEHFNAPTVVLCGGVACNGLLRERMKSVLPAKHQLVISHPKFCTDNAAMIAGLACHYYREKRFDSHSLDAYSRMSELSSVVFV